MTRSKDTVWRDRWRERHLQHALLAATVESYFMSTVSN